MIGLDYVLAGYLHMAAFQPTCEMKQAPEVTVAATGATVKVDESKDISQLDTFKPNLSASPYGEGIETHIEGLAKGSIGLTGRYEFGTRTYPALNVSCLFVNKVRIEIHLEPTIYIAREYKKGTCHYNAVMEHERKHVAVDRYIVNKYTKILVKAVNNTLKHIGYAHGPFNAAQIPSVQQKIDTVVSSVIGQYSENMSTERNKLQAKIDTLEEYERVSKKCPDKPGR